MNNKDTKSAIQGIANVINNYVEHSYLFSGGCCYSAYVIAKHLEMLGIKYRTVLFQYADVLKVRSFKKAFADPDSHIAHVAIQVKYEGRWLFFGSCDGIIRYFTVNDYEYKVRVYRGITSEQLKKAYYGREWNWMYDRSNNGPLMRDIKRVAEKYVEANI